MLTFFNISCHPKRQKLSTKEKSVSRVQFRREKKQQKCFLLFDAWTSKKFSVKNLNCAQFLCWNPAKNDSWSRPTAVACPPHHVDPSARVRNAVCIVVSIVPRIPEQTETDQNKIRCCDWLIFFSVQIFHPLASGSARAPWPRPTTLCCSGGRATAASAGSRRCWSARWTTYWTRSLRPTGYCTCSPRPGCTTVSEI